jgi:hypothetical protein
MANRTLNELIRQYVRSRTEPAVSISSAARAIAAVMPDCPVAGRDFDNAVARMALAEGYAVVFDRTPEDASGKPAAALDR